MSLFAELKRRNVIRMAGLYLVGAWLVTQVASTVLPMFGAPEWLPRTIVILLAIGFVPTLVFSWIYELTPEGIRRDADVPPAQSIGRETGRRPLSAIPGLRGTWTPARRIDFAIIAVLLVALAYFAVDKFAFAPQRESGRAVPAPAGRNAAKGNAAPVAEKPRDETAATDATAIPDKSIAVLPFANLSEEKANAFFADGIQDEILTRLAKIGTLKVISRTSTLRYASQPDDLPQIARQLGVAHILEGSVQKAADAVRINVQLIRAEGDSHVWAETYDRKLDNVFGVESEVAKAIADALDAKLSGAEKAELARKPTTNADAWEAYLHGLALYDRPDLLTADQIEAGKAFEKAVQLDAGFAVAWAALAVADAGLYFTDTDTSAARRDAARKAVAQAVRLGPDAYETRRAQAYYAYFVERDYDGARAIFEEIRGRAPSDAEIPRALALIARRQARWSDSDQLFSQALELDPRNQKVLLWAADNGIAERRFADALRLLERFTDIAPGDLGALGREATIRTVMGDLAGAEAAIERMHADVSGIVVLRANLLWLQRRYAEGVTLLRAPPAAADTDDLGQSDWLLGEFLRLSGDAAGARRSYVAARDLARRTIEQQPENVSMIANLALCEAALGNRDAALSLARKAVAMLPASKDALRGPGNEEILARIQLRFGENDAALAGLEHLLATPYQSPYRFGAVLTPAVLRLDPDFDALRDDPRFRKLAATPDVQPLPSRKP